jgi:UDP-N-acetylglucosamine 4,6-dehydratase/5-epimerase
MDEMFNNKIILITGGTGSFGNAFVRHLLKNRGIKEIRIFSRDEKKQNDMRKLYNNDKLKFYIGDVRTRSSVDDVMRGVDYVFHAAALKQVPSGEFFPMEMVKTNILGADNVMHSAIEHKVKRVTVLSTDKAVYPINAMGMTKALMEKTMIAISRNLQEGETILCGTRYGNVMGSRGSVIPLFIRQIKENKPVTITNPEMTRFLMSLEESIELVLFSYKNGANGDIFVQKSPASTILDLATALKEIFSANNEIKIIGTRHGEKLYESLVTQEDMIRAEDLGKYYRIPADTRDLNYDIYFEKGEKDISKIEEYNSHNTERLNVEQVKEKLLGLNIVKKNL